MKKIKILRKLQICKFGSVYYLVHISSKEDTELAIKVPEFP
jgi:hypothetical protein